MNMTEVGRKIATLRKRKDMTQLELADKMGISFQAVSNWERGLSMPDISKLPELASLFEVSIGELLGEEATPVVKVMESHEDTLVTPKELVDAAPLLKPSQVDTLAAQLPVTDFDEITPLLPFVGTELVDVWGEEAAKGKQLGNLNELASFMSDKGLERCAKILHEMGEDAVILYPFMGLNYLDEEAERIYEEQGAEGLVAIAPFAHGACLGKLARRAYEEHDMEGLDGLLPFLFSNDIKKLATLVMKKEGISGLTPLVPFMNSSDVNAILSDWHPSHD